jgi:hypothetical protein
MTGSLFKENGMRAPRLNDERGIALAVAVFALVVIGALVAGTFFAGRLEQQTGQNTLYLAQASEAAEAGLSQALGSAQGATYDAMPVVGPQGDPTDLGTLNLGSHRSVTTELRRITPSLYLLEAIGNRGDAAGRGLAARRLGALVKLSSANIAVHAGLTAIGDVVVNGNATVSGNDAIPTSWSTPPAVDCPATDNVTGILYNGTLSKGGSSVVTGEPASQSDSTLNASNIFGGSNFDELKALKTLTLTGNISGLAPAVTGNPPVCNAAVQSNWGAPTDKASPCFNYFPIIYHYGDLSISGSGEGQGILLVEGNLSVQGRIDFYGPVIVTGEVDVRGTGSDDVKFYGGILAQNVALDDNRLAGNATVNYSSCAIHRALRGSALVKPLAERGWMQLY